MKLLAIQLLYVTQIKTNIHDETLSLSPLILESANIDFDGDELWGICLNEMDAVNDFQSIHPRVGMLSVSSPEVSQDISLSDQTLLMLHKYVHSSPIYDPVIVKY